jgi:hypothetical protein
MLCMILGVLALAMPITVLGNNFNGQFLANRQKGSSRLQVQQMSQGQTVRTVS